MATQAPDYQPATFAYPGRASYVHMRQALQAPQCPGLRYRSGRCGQLSSWQQVLSGCQLSAPTWYLADLSSRLSQPPAIASSALHGKHGLAPLFGHPAEEQVPVKRDGSLSVTKDARKRKEVRHETYNFVNAGIN
jgi:hypothetical protein